MQDVCGALLGSSIALGMKYGRARQELDSHEIMGQSLAMVGMLYKWFEKEFGSVICHEVTARFAGGVHYDVTVPWQAELAEEAGVLDKCHELIGKVAARVVEMMWDDLEKEKKK